MLCLLVWVMGCDGSGCRLEDWITQNAAKSDDGFISREDFLQFAALHIPGVEGALTVSFSVDELTTS